MTGSVGSNRRRNRRQCPEPAPFWGADVAQDSSSSSHPCPSCRGLSSFCRNCHPEVPGSLTPVREMKEIAQGRESPWGTSQFSQSRHERASALAVRREPLREGDGLGLVKPSDATLVSVPSEAKPGDKLLLTRTHRLDQNGGCQATDWECNVVHDEGLDRSPPAPDMQPSPAPPEIGQLFLARPGTIDSFNDPEVSTAASLVDLRDNAHQRMMECNQKLHKQLEFLEQEKLQIQELYTKSTDQNKRLESELEKTRKRCSELECLVRQGVAQTAQAKSTHDENQELRKQLAAYSVEIDVLREDLRMANLPLESTGGATKEGAANDQDVLERQQKDIKEKNGLQHDFHAKDRGHHQDLNEHADQRHSRHSKYTGLDEEHLRKQLVAYAVEIDVLREDLRVSTGRATEEGAANDQDMLERLQKDIEEENGTERDNNRGQHHDLKEHADQRHSRRSKSTAHQDHAKMSDLETERDNYRDQHQELDKKYTALDEEHQDLGRRKKELDDIHKALEEKHHILDLSHGDLRERHKNIEEELQLLGRTCGQQQEKICELEDCLRLYKEKADTLLEELVKQTGVFNTFVQDVRRISGEAGGIVLKGNKDLASRIKVVDFSACEYLYQMTSRTDRWKVSRARMKLCFSHWVVYYWRIRRTLFRPYLRFDIAWEMACARQGFILKKLRHDKDVFEDRLVMLDAEVGILRWGDAKQGSRPAATLKKHALTGHEEKDLVQRFPQAKGLKELVQKRSQEPHMYCEFHKECVDCGCLRKLTRELDLREVTCIDYGVLNRASVVADEKPWKCFSLWTKARSFDFVCADPEVARCFVLAISRVIYCIKGNTHGSTPGRKSLSGNYPPLHQSGDRHMKIEAYCERNHPMPSGATECVWKCGAAKQLDVCTKNHRMKPGQVSCSACGNFRKKRVTKKSKKTQEQTPLIGTGQKSTWHPTLLPEWTHWVRGSVQTRGRYIAMQGWCKLSYYAAANNTTVPKYLLQALMKSVLQQGSVIDTGSTRRDRPSTVHPGGHSDGRDPPLPPPHGLPN